MKTRKYETPSDLLLREQIFSVGRVIAVPARAEDHSIPTSVIRRDREAETVPAVKKTL